MSNRTNSTKQAPAMNPFADGAIDRRVANAVISQHTAHRNKIEAMAARTATESPEYAGDILWAVA